MEPWFQDFIHEWLKEGSYRHMANEVEVTRRKRSDRNLANDEIYKLDIEKWMKIYKELKAKMNVILLESKRDPQTNVLWEQGRGPLAWFHLDLEVRNTNYLHCCYVLFIRK